MSNVIEFPTETPPKKANDKLPVGLEVDTKTFDKLVNAARLFDTSVDDVLGRLVAKGLLHECKT